MAFAQLLETLDPDRLPIHGGDATSMFVTIGLDDLRKDLAAADLGRSQRLFNRAHDDHYLHTELPIGDVRFTRRT